LPISEINSVSNRRLPIKNFISLISFFPCGDYIPINTLDIEDQKIAQEMFENLKYLLGKYHWIEVYEYCWRTMANRMCGNVEGRCKIIHKIKQAEYGRLKNEEKKKI